MTKTQTMLCIIFLLNLTFMVDGTRKGVALVNGVAELFCPFEKLQSIPKHKIDIYWQRDKEGRKEVLNAMSIFNGSSHISKRYQNRTTFQENGGLKIFNVNLEDQGEYEGYLMYLGDKGREKVDHCIYHLDVYANYSEPEISYEPLVQIVDNGTILHLKCSSGDGFPRPRRIIWKTSSGNYTKEFNKVTEIKNISKTFNASSELSLKVEEDVNITCVLVAHHIATSKVLQIVLKREILPVTPNWNLIIILSVIIIICFTAISITLAVRIKKKKARANVPGSKRGHEMEQVAEGSPEQHNLMPTECETATGQ